MWRPPVILSDRADPRSEFRAVVEVRTILTWLGAAREGASGDISARIGETERDKPEGGAQKQGVQPLGIINKSTAEHSGM